MEELIRQYFNVPVSIALVRMSAIETKNIFDLVLYNSNTPRNWARMWLLKMKHGNFHTGFKFADSRGRYIYTLVHIDGEEKLKRIGEALFGEKNLKAEIIEIRHNGRMNIHYV
jgi:hypothetical protein